MRFITPQIAWHSTNPVFSVDFHHSGRLATGGADKIVNIWRIEADGTATFLSQIVKHSRAVNVVRFSPDGKYLATAGDDGLIHIWKLSEQKLPPVVGMGQHPDDFQNVEDWVIASTLNRGGKDIYALEWSPDSTELVSGTFDGTVYLWHWQRQQGQRCHEIKDHFTIVQGVSYDPLNSLLVTESSDRSARIYKKNKNGNRMHCAHHLRARVTDQLAAPSKSNAMQVDANATDEANSSHQPKHFQHKYFLDDSVPTFFRRPTWSPEGQLLLLPCGQFVQSPQQTTPTNATWVFTRGNLTGPACHIASKEPSIAARFSPVLYEASASSCGSVDKNDSHTSGNGMEGVVETSQTQKLFDLPYKMIFAIATMDAILIYDTEHLHPIGMFQEGHYDRMTDLAWSQDGLHLVASNADGYATIFTFDAGELGKELDAAVAAEIMKPAMEAKIPKPPAPKKPKASAAVAANSDPNSTSPNPNTATTGANAAEDEDEDEEIDEKTNDGAVINFDEAPVNETPAPSTYVKKTGKRIVPTLVNNPETTEAAAPQ